MIGPAKFQRPTGCGEKTLGNEWDKKRKIGQLGTVQLDPTGPEVSSRKG